MSTIILSNHAQTRSQQRGIGMDIIEYLLQYGASCYCKKGCKKYFFDKKSLGKIRSSISSKKFAKIESKLRCFAVVSADRVVVTVGHQFKKVWR